MCYLKSILSLEPWRNKFFVGNRAFLPHTTDKGEIKSPFTLIEEEPQSRRVSPVARVERTAELMKSEVPPDFILCLRVKILTSMGLGRRNASVILELAHNAFLQL